MNTKKVERSMQMPFGKVKKRRGKTLYECNSLLRERNYYAAMMVREGEADAMLSGFS